MPSAIKKPVRTSKRAANFVNKPQPTTAIKLTGATATGLTVAATFDQAVILNGVPAYTTDVAGAHAVSAVLTSPNVVTITFSASVAAATELNIPYEEPAVRNSSGGFVSTSTFPV
jgi:hypothetical protein